MSKITIGRRLAVVIGLFVFTAGTARAQHCLTPDAVTDAMHAYAVKLATDTTLVATRDLYQILPVAESEVEIVTQSSTCKDAKDAYKAELGFNGNRRVHVIRIGSRFMVMNPDTKAGEYQQFLIFDDQFGFLAAFAG